MSNLRFEFEACLEKHPVFNACYISFPYDVKEIFHTTGQVKVKAWIDGYYYRGSLANMGLGLHILPIIKNVRTSIQKNAGDRVNMVIEPDTEERILELPEDMRIQLASMDQGLEYFESLAFTHRKEYINWVNSAKKPETRERRLQQFSQMILEKQNSGTKRKK